MPTGPGFLPTFLYYFTITATTTALLIAQLRGVNFASAAPVQFGTLVGVCAGVLGALLNRSATIELTYKQRPPFLQKLNAALAELGFELQSQPEDPILLYQRKGFAKLSRETVYIELQRQTATLMSRSGVLRQIQQRLDQD